MILTKFPSVLLEDSHGGKFIMWALAVNGEHPNNKVRPPLRIVRSHPLNPVLLGKCLDSNMISISLYVNVYCS